MRENFEDKLADDIKELFFNVGKLGRMKEFHHAIRELVISQRKDAIESLGLEHGRKYKIMKSDAVIVLEKIDD